MQTGLVEPNDQAPTGGATATATSTSTSSGPTVTIHTGDGDTVTLGPDEIQMYLVAIQTVLLVYVTVKEATA